MRDIIRNLGKYENIFLPGDPEKILAEVALMMSEEKIGLTCAATNEDGIIGARVYKVS